MRKTLPVNFNIVSQDTGWNCGPATCENILFARGKNVPESVLAKELKTTVNGTDYIGYLDNVLSARSGIDYLTQNIPGNDATQAQRDEFWKRLVAAIDAGFGIAMNWIAPPSNYPKGVNGSKSPSYGGGTVYHYVAAMGYDDSNQTVFVVDSGFNPKTYWITLKQCCSLIAGKGYAYPNVAPKPAPNAINDKTKGVAWLGKRLTANEQKCPDGKGRFVQFENGYCYWHPATGAHIVPNHLFEAWASYKWETGPLGYPVRDHTVVDGGDVQAFQHGVLYRKYGQPGFYVTGMIGKRWANEGFETGPLGWPTSNEYDYDNGKVQDFERGKLAWSPDGVVRVIENG